ncbi:MAG TPA: caspase family protein, partial [Thermoanaerobaculia bacterium]|nr:caspase family protein [Thermoanaerobaculia bacterium]
MALLLCASAAIAGVGPIDAAVSSDPVEATQSAALFVGIREFPDDSSIAEVRYAVDDAIDLAFAFSLDASTRLVDPKQVVLALSGEPQKPQSSERLKVLIANGALTTTARTTDIMKLLESQARRVGPQGALIATFATHGINEDGAQYLFAADSLLVHRAPSLSEGTIRDIVAQTGVARSLILIDACRQRLTRNSRAVEADPRSRAVLLRELGEISGQVVFAAAASGKFAYDDDVRQNGVFTSRVIDGLHCEARADARGFITVDALA